MRPEGGEPVLRITGLTIALPPNADRRHAVEDVSFSVAAGEIVCIVGESGSGKSVTAFSIMRLLSRGLRSVSGTVAFGGEDLLRKSERAMRRLRGNRLAMIFQEPATALSPTMTVGRQIEEPFRVHTAMGKGERRTRALQLMTLVNLPEPGHLIGRYPHELSGGQRQRVMIAMALALEPALLIADEPTTALDVTTQAQIIALIRSLQRRSNAGVLFVTHDLSLVSEIADRVVVMQQGKLVEEGRAADVLANPRHPYTQALLAAIPGLSHRRRTRQPPGANLLQVERLSKTYTSGGLFRTTRTITAVRDVSLNVRRGETVALVGESGSGKSTVARCIAGLVQLTSGRIVVGSTNDEKRSDEVQIVFQDPNRSLDPRWTVGRSLVEGLRNRGIGRTDARKRAGRLLERVGIPPEAMTRYPHQFSGGQRQRICIARALTLDPTLLIADEAVSALDVSVQAQVLTLLQDLQHDLEIGMLFITHDLRVAAQISDRIAVMQRGVIMEEGGAVQLIAAPQHPYTKLLFDSAFGLGGAVSATEATIIPDT
ncbi:MAG: ABC transporter ATP-binding protein [Methylobacteriaceae bacterium]|nr:ABC transporter ATP-binding protein [Methylobacteriaceae bacterium]